MLRRDRKVRASDADELARERFAGGLVEVRHHDPKAATRIVEFSELRVLMIARPHTHERDCVRGAGLPVRTPMKTRSPGLAPPTAPPPSPR